MAMLAISFLLLALYFREGNGFHQKQITQPASLPQRFFPSHSSVTDYPFGNLQGVIKLLADEELIFVMYYAPWCAQSVYIRGEFIKAAKVLSETVKFAAVNCWYPDGECRQRMKFIAFPELFMYHTGVGDGYRFTGIKEAEYFVKFAESFLFPLTVLHSENQIKEFTSSNDNTVIGYFDFNSSPQPPGADYYQYYLTALRVMSYDFYQPVRFGVVNSHRLSQLLDISSSNRFIMTRVGNVTLKYPLVYNMTSKNMTTWILHYKQKNLSPWLVPPGIKSLTLSVPLQQGPSVLVFGPSNPLVHFNPYQNMARVASLAYRTCGNNTRYFENILRTFVFASFAQHLNVKEYHKKCLEKKSPVLNSDFSSYHHSKCCVSLMTGSKFTSENDVCEYCVKRSNSDTVCDIELGPDSTLDWSQNTVNSCFDFHKFYNVNEHHSVCCRNGFSKMPNLHIKTESGRLRRNTDPFILNGERLLCKQYMNKLTLQKMKRLMPIDEMSKLLTKFSDLRNGNITGLQCNTNTTLDFYYIDSVYHSVFMEKLKVPSQPKQTSVILVDLNDETLFVLKDQLDYQSLGKFVRNYTEGTLSRYRQSTEVTSPVECLMSNSVCIKEVNADTYQDVVMNKHKDVILLYYTDWCGFCSQMSKVFLSAAQYFKDNTDLIFARINGDSNDLPWEYTVDSYPTIIFFPAYRKSDSVQYPENVPKTVPNLVKFLLFHSNHSLQVDTAMHACTPKCVKKNIDRALSEISKLEASINRLERRATTLLTRPLDSANYNKYVKAALVSLKRAQDVKTFKLRKAQLLNYFLQKDFKRFDKQMMLEIIAKNAAL
ncbi:Thioredoxin domain-containing protein 11 [Mactra antiquata]